MAISKNSKRIQFTLNISKEKENQIAKFLDGYLNPNAAIKEIIFNYIVTHCDTQLIQVTQSEVSQSHPKELQASDFNDNIVNDSEYKSVEVSKCESELHEVSEIEQNELDELSKFL